MTYQDMAKFKYQVLVDGTVAPYRTSNLMQLDTVILKQASSKSDLTVGLRSSPSKFRVDIAGSILTEAPFLVERVV